MRASVDIGSNSLLLLVVDGQGAVVHDEARVVGLGRGLGERGMVHFRRKPRALEQELDVLLEAPQDGAEAARLMGEVADFLNFGLEGREHGRSLAPRGQVLQIRRERGHKGSSRRFTLPGLDPGILFRGDQKGYAGQARVR